MSELRSDLSASELADIQGQSLYNADLAPVPSTARQWGTWNIAALWIGMSVCIPTYMLAAGMIDAGMSWGQAILTVLLGNLIVVVPIILVGHAGTKYGITFPVFARAAFGTGGAHVATLARAIVACGWFGIQTWIGGLAIYQLLQLAWPSLSESVVIGFLSNDAVQVNVAQFVCFLLFWLLNIGLFVWRGMDSIKWVENWGAPLLITLGIALFIWGYQAAGGLQPMLSQESKFEEAGQFWKVFFPQLTAMVGFWATLSLNIPDFTRQAKSQRDQVLGQVLGLNTTMPLFAFIGVAVTGATVIVFGKPIWNPVDLLAEFDTVYVMVISIFALLLATLTTNMAANIVAPATAFSNIAPRVIGMRTGCLLTGIVGILMMPWKLLADPSGYVFTWLIGYSALLGPIAAILICDYYVVRKTELDLAELYRPRGRHRGFSPAAMFALVLAVAINVPGFLGTIGILDAKGWASGFVAVYDYAWFLGFAIAFIAYLLSRSLSKEEPK
ncbi:MAG: NCS1 family nucleobase:cation symporter-1 [Planctomycetota bacterium]